MSKYIETAPSGNGTKDENILIIKHGALGDFVLASGKLLTVRRRHPGARLVLITDPVIAPLARSMGIFDEIVEDPRDHKVGTWWRVVKRTIADPRWDIIYDFQASNRTLCRYHPLAVLLTPHAMCWARSARGGLVLMESPAKPPLLPRSWRSRFEPVEWMPRDLSMCRSSKENFSLLPDRYALLIPGCSFGNEKKRWPPDRYRTLSGYLAENGLKSVVMGTKDEAAEINTICKDNPNTVNFMGKSRIEDIPELAGGAEVVVGNDTGPTHIAYIAGAKTVMLFLSEYVSAAPKDVPHAVYLHGKSISDITLEEVEAAADRFLTR